MVDGSGQVSHTSKAVKVTLKCQVHEDVKAMLEDISAATGYPQSTEVQRAIREYHRRGGWRREVSDGRRAE